MSDSERIELPKAVKAGGAIPNAWMTIGDPYLAEIVAASGEFFAVTLDMQHGLIDQRKAIECIRAIRGMGISALVRLPGLDDALIGILLDAAADGLILPQTDSAKEAERFVAACNYPPIGTRSFGPTRRSLISNQYDPGFVTFCMIETLAGPESVTEIAAVDGLDGIFIGPGDLGISLGLGPGQDRSEPEYAKAVSNIKSAAKGADKALGIHANKASFAAEKACEGFQLVTTWVDVVGIKNSIDDAANLWRTSIGDRLRAKK